MKKKKEVIYVMSDSHIADNCRNSDTTDILEFIHLIDKISKKNKLILLGDILELWQGVNSSEKKRAKEILLKFPMLKEIFNRDNVFYVRGNHDFSIKKIKNIKCYDKLILEIKDKKILFLHGHQFDKFNRGKKPIGKIATEFWGILELIFGNKTINKFLPFIYEFIYSILLKKKRKGNRYFYRKNAITLAKKEKVDIIVLGHTHLKDYYKKDGIEYYNSGCWVNGKKDILTIII